MNLIRNSRRFTVLFLLSGAVAFSGCGGSPLGGSDDGGGGGNPTQATAPEYCSTTNSYAGGVTVSGTAEFQYRPTDPDLGLSGNPVNAPIPMAEIRVLNQAGTTVQCSTTSTTGVISFTLPAGAATYTLKIYSRSITTKLKVSVNEDYYANAPYVLSKTFTLPSGTSPYSVGNIVASARQSTSAKIEGGAFNIYNQIWRANEYIRTTTSNAAFVAPLVNVYWKKGYNPYDYFGGGPLLSFYRPGYRQLFILGGNAGAVSNVDTDHFDNSVIIHEYGHFLEDVFAKSDSPGGSHNGNFIIDPRLAWSEGWANFFQAAVLKSYDSSWQYYIDTNGFKNDSVEGGIGKLLIKIDMTLNNGKCASTPSPFNTYSCDPVGTSGEGTYREMSISRYLFKTLNTANVPFSAVWQAFSNTETGGVASGLSSSLVSFRNIGLFNYFLGNIIGGSYPSWATVLTEEKQNKTPYYYADMLDRVTVNTCEGGAGRSLTPTVDQSGSKSNLFTSNDFYRFDYNGTASTIQLTYTGGSSNMDLDLHLYKEDYLYQETNASSNGTIARSSARTWAIEQGSESINMSGLPAGRYLLNIKAYTAGKLSSQLGGPAIYKLKITQGSTTEDLCPANSN